MMTVRQHQCLVLLRKVVLTGRRRDGRNQAKNITENPIILVATTPVIMNLHQALPHPAHQVMIIGQQRSTARGVDKIGTMIGTSTVVITIGITAVMNIILLTPPSFGIKQSLTVLWKITSKSSCRILKLKLTVRFITLSSTISEIVTILFGETMKLCSMAFDVFTFSGNLRFNLLPHLLLISRETVGIAFLIAALNGLDACAADIGNAYLNADCKERIWVKVGGGCFLWCCFDLNGVFLKKTLYVALCTQSVAYFTVNGAF